MGTTDQLVPCGTIDQIGTDQLVPMGTTDQLVSCGTTDQLGPYGDY